MKRLAYPAACLSLALLYSSAGAQTVVATQAQLKSFLGGKGGLLAFTDQADGNKLKYIDINDASLTIKTLDSGSCNSPRFSLDGTRVAYLVNDKIYARRISGGDKVHVATTGTDKSKGPGYWYKSGTTEYIIYADATAKYGYDSGKTFKIKIKNGIEPDGSPVKIYDKAYDGGITPDGKWIGEAYGDRHAYNLEASKEYIDFFKADGAKEGQCCNASMAPLNGPYRMVTLVLPHDYFRTWQYDAGADKWKEYRTYTKPSGTEEWQTPEWSLHPDYITVTAKQGGYDLYIQHAHDKGKRIKVIDGDVHTSHLYVGGTTAPGCGGDGECDDGNPCTADKCNAGSCSNTSISGCCTKNSQCDDGDPCTQDSCSDNTCAATAISGCCTKASQCDDGSDCTSDSCEDNKCAHAPVPACCTADADCADTSPCTVDRCDKATGACENTSVAGCCAVDTDCDDGDDCTLDACNEESNTCQHEPSAGCGLADAGPASDAGPAGDGPATDAGPTATDDDGSSSGTVNLGATREPLVGGCAVHGRPGEATWLLLFGALLLLRRRRRQMP